MSADMRATIMLWGIEGLIVAVAFGVAIWQWRRRRNKGDDAP